ncbi:hypothetical protein JZ785_14410 [Alicyclobacillus curvatus]|nr:hypothetical protein JZ785_14410 [Alicyclobacillus curvatus]
MASVLASVLPTTSVAMAAVNPVAASTMSKMVIDLDGQQVAAPYGLAAIDPSSGQQTTFMPIYYVMQALKNGLSIQSTWDGNNWNLTLPSGMSPSVTLKAMSAPTNAFKSVFINNVRVATVPSVNAKDPTSGQVTTYVPIWYIIQILKDVNVQSNWNGTSWVMGPSTSNSASTSSVDNWSVQFKGNSLVWGQLPNAKYYTVTVERDNGIDVTKLYQANTKAVSFNLLGNSKISQSGYYDVSVTATFSGNGQASVSTASMGTQDYPYEVTNGKVVQGVTNPIQNEVDNTTNWNPQFKGNSVVWNKLKYVQYYDVTISDNNGDQLLYEKTQALSFNLLSKTSISKPGNYEVDVSVAFVNGSGITAPMYYEIKKGASSGVTVEPAPNPWSSAWN